MNQASSAHSIAICLKKASTLSRLDPVEMQMTLETPPATLEEAGKDLEGTLDRAIEHVLEEAAKSPDKFQELYPLVERTWLRLEEFDGNSSCYEINVRAAEFLGSLNKLQGTDTVSLTKLARSKDWHERLVAGWSLRGSEAPEHASIIAKLKEDDFTDDKGTFLVLETVGV